MTITLITKECISTLSLPQRASGRFWICDRDPQGHSRQIANVEGQDGQWLLCSTSELTILDSQGQPTRALALTNELHSVNAYYCQDHVSVLFLVDPAGVEAQEYRKYSVHEDCRLNIGRGKNNQIVINNNFVSSRHACLIWKSGQWSITDTQSSNGTFVNSIRIATRQLDPGDVIFIMGVKIIVGAGFFGINDPGHCVTISGACVGGLDSQLLHSRSTQRQSAQKALGFSRSPRICQRIQKSKITIDASPAPYKQDEIPLALLVGPALTMGMTAIVMAAVAYYNYYEGYAEMITVFPTLVMSFVMLCSTVLWPLLTKYNEKKKRLAAERVREEKYRGYLDNIRGQIYCIGEEQRRILYQNCPSTYECEERILQCKDNLWERSLGQEDLLQLRLGLGDRPLQVDLVFQERHFSIDDDPLQNEMYRLIDTPLIVKDAPILCSLLQNEIVGVVGEKERTFSFLQGLILQIAALHSYEDVKLVFFVSEADIPEWDFMRLLPHAWGSFRYYATNSGEAKTVALELEQIIQERMERDDQAGQTTAPYYVVVAVDPSLVEREGLYKKIQDGEGKLGMSCIAIAPQLAGLPKECSFVIELHHDQSFCYDRDHAGGEETAFRVEKAPADMHKAASILSDLVMNTDSDRFILPNLLTFLEMYGVGKTEHLNALTRWHENSPVNSLRAPIGVGEDGETFYLDLHENAHGPHGLIAGMTGSGKSEFIITLILSLAVNYHPHEVAFILIDYKGGGLTGAFEDGRTGLRLPHLAGSITNLDGAEVNRALVSIQSELRRRQAAFNEAKRISGEGTIDIYKYQKMYRSGSVSTPIPHLFVISDEFAELKTQQPDFMAQLISTARIGRSLGVHLILATQKPAGVVNDQIWSNSRFRICLKVQEKADSTEMLKRPDAAELQETGRFYLQVGFDELFKLGQSAWCGAPYLPTDIVEEKQDNSIEVIDHLGRVLLESAEKKTSSQESSVSQVVSIVNYLSKLAHEEHIQAQQLWQPPIPPKIYLKDLCEKYSWQKEQYHLNPVIGEYDDPFHQAKGLLTIPFSREGNALIYGAAGSGKDMVLNTMLVCLLDNYNAEELNVYILDLGEETLQAFAGAPQVGNVMLISDGKRIENLMKMLQKETETRKKLFAEHDGDYASYCQNTKKSIPQILVIIRNFAVFTEQFEHLEQQLLKVTRECSKYGIFFVITTNAANTIRYRMAQNFTTVYSLQMNDKSDYISIFGNTGGVFPSRIRGRGLCRLGQIYEFQAAHFGEDHSLKALRAFSERLAKQSSSCAAPIPVMPDRVTPQLFPEDFIASAVPIGVEALSLKPAVWDLAHAVVTPLLARSFTPIGPVLQGVAEQLSRSSCPVTVLDGAGILDEPLGAAYNYIGSDFEQQIQLMFEEFILRNNGSKEALADSEPRYYIITSLRDVLDSLSDDSANKLVTILQGLEPEHRFYMVLCDMSAGFSDFSGEEWFKKQIKDGQGIWVGNGVADQSLLWVRRVASFPYRELPPHYGYFVRCGRPMLVNLIIGEAVEGEEW